jgi:hypothetical protein
VGARGSHRQCWLLVYALQGDKERSLDISISSLMDRSVAKVPQVGIVRVMFFAEFSIPLHVTLVVLETPKYRTRESCMNL